MLTLRQQQHIINIDEQEGERNMQAKQEITSNLHNYFTTMIEANQLSVKKSQKPANKFMRVVKSILTGKGVL